MRRTLISISWTLVLTCLLGCAQPPIIHKLAGFAQGTTYHISYWSANPVNEQAIKTDVENMFNTIDQQLSNYRSDSVIERFNQNENTTSQQVGSEIVGLVRIAQKVHQASQGCYDLTIKPLFELWGFRNEQFKIPSDTEITATLKQVSMSKLEIVNDQHLRKQQATLKVDLSSIAQGYSVNKISKVLEQHGIQNYLVEIGGELVTNGYKPDKQPWRIALERPLPGQQVLHKVITLPTDVTMAVMTSGTYRHYFDANGQRYSHILDARLGKPVAHDLVSVTVLHPDPSVADAWSTALLCLGQEQGMIAANAGQIAALFITQRDSQLLESKSAALNSLSSVIIH